MSCHARTYRIQAQAQWWCRRAVCPASSLATSAPASLEQPAPERPNGTRHSYAFTGIEQSSSNSTFRFRAWLFFTFSQLLQPQASIDVHLEQCIQKWEDAQLQKPRQHRQSLPECPYLTPEMTQTDFNRAARQLLKSAPSSFWLCLAVPRLA